MSGYAWLPDRKGTVTGFVVAGFGAGAAVFDAVATAVVNPTDAPTDDSTGYYGEVCLVCACSYIQSLFLFPVCFANIGGRRVLDENTQHSS